MSMESSGFRDAIRPQDAVAILITLLGVAIAIFLDESIIKLIGGSIAVLAGMALYMTIRQRMEDQVQLKARRTTLPPPSFKTRVTTDPATSTTRIVFDDYQQTFTPDDDEPEEQENGFEARPSTASPASRTQTTTAATRGNAVTAVDAIGDESVEELASYTGTGGEAFRVIKTRREQVADRPPAEAEISRGEEAPAREVSDEEESSAPSVAPAPDQSNSTTGRRSIDVTPSSQREAIELPDLDTVGTGERGRPVETSAATETVEPLILTAPVEEVRTEPMTSRRQARIVLEELWSESDEESRGGEPRAEFVRLVGQVLNAVARSIQARSIVFSWVNLEKQHLIPEAKVTTGSHEIRTGARIPIANDVISQIARSGIPEIITDISPAAERELIPYYGAPAGTHSFVGVPVFFRREVVGVLSLDDAGENAFDEGAVATLAEYTRLISGLIRGYTEKYDLQLTARTLDAFGSLHRALTGTTQSPRHIAEILSGLVSDLFDALYVAVVLFDEEERTWKIAAIDSQTLSEDLRAIEPEMTASLVGRATRFAEEIYLERIDQEARFHPDEPFESGGAFLALPVVATTRCYGALAIEHTAPSALIPRDLDLLRDLVRYAAMAIEVVHVNRAIETRIVVDDATGLYNLGYLMTTLERESLRARDHRTPLSFALLSVDLPQSLREASKETEDVLVESIGEVVGGTLRPYMTLGRFDDRTLGVVLVGQNDQEAYLWAEKLRKDVASRIIPLGGRKLSVTISAGISDLGELDGSTQLVDGARQALEKARSGNGNAVILY